MAGITDILQDYNIGISFVLVVIAIAMLALVYYVLEHFIGRHIEGKRDGWLIMVFDRFKQPVKILFFLTLFVIALQVLIEDLAEQVWYQKAYAIGVICILSWVAIKGIGAGSDIFLRRFDISLADNLKARRIYTQVRILRRILVTVIIFVGLACSLMVFDEIRALGVSLIASAGLGAIVLGLAAQKTLGNFFTGLQIAITQPIRIDDAVIVEGEWGTIEEINLTYVVVKIWDLRRLILPINYFTDHAFQNWTRHSANLLGPIVLYLDYALPVDALRAELDRIMETREAKAMWDGAVKGVQVINASERTMEIRVLVSAANAPTAWNLRCHVREKLIAFVQEHYPHCLPLLRTAWDNPGGQQISDEHSA